MVAASVELDIEQPADFRRALALIDETMRPYPEAESEALAVELGVRTRQKAEGEMTAKLRRKVFGKLLGGYPADVARTAVETWSATNTFHPSEHELRALADELFAERKMLRAGIAGRLPKGSALPQALVDDVARLGRKAEHWLEGAELLKKRLILKSAFHRSRFREALESALGGHVATMDWLKDRGVEAVEVLPS